MCTFTLCRSVGICVAPPKAKVRILRSVELWSVPFCIVFSRLARNEFSVHRYMNFTPSSPSWYYYYSNVAHNNHFITTLPIVQQLKWKLFFIYLFSRFRSCIRGVRAMLVCTGVKLGTNWGRREVATQHYRWQVCEKQSKQKWTVSSFIHRTEEWMHSFFAPVQNRCNDLVTRYYRSMDGG